VYPTGILKHYNITCSARAFDGTLYSGWFNSSTIDIDNSPPSAVTLGIPTMDSILINRTPVFNWTRATDIDNDSLQYRLIVDDTQTFDFPEVNVTVSSLNFTPFTELDFDTYYWFVQAYDGEGFGANSSTRNFTVISSIVISLVNDSIIFPPLLPNATDNTTDNSPYPFVLRNDGNTWLDIYINSTSIWQTVGTGTAYFRTKVDRALEGITFNWTGSQTSWLNMQDEVKIIDHMNYTNTNDTAEIDVLLRVPTSEPMGEKSAQVTIYARQG
jgi:hypothetical protein